jgi:hypothetical protein
MPRHSTEQLILLALPPSTRLNAWVRLSELVEALDRSQRDVAEAIGWLEVTGRVEVRDSGVDRDPEIRLKETDNGRRAAA